MEYLSSQPNRGADLTGRTFIVSVNEKGRMTLPAKIRELLQMMPEPSFVEMAVLADGRIAIQGRLPTVAETAGAVAPLEPQKDWKEIEAIVMDDVAERYRDKLQR